jgi:hypothetical protein
LLLLLLLPVRLLLLLLLLLLRRRRRRRRLCRGPEAAILLARASLSGGLLCPRAPGSAWRHLQRAAAA